MSKRTVKFFTLLVAITALLSAIFIIVGTIVTARYGDESIGSTVFGEVRIFFDLVAEFSVYGIILFSFVHYKLETALKSFYFAIGSFAFAFLFEFFAEMIFFISVEGANPDVLAIYITGLLNNCIASLTLKRIIPTIIVAIIAYKFAKNGTSAPKKFISFKNPVTRTMAVFSIALFSINIVSLLATDIYTVCSAIPSMTKTEFKDSIGEFVLGALPAYGLTILYFLVFLYCALYVVYYACKKHTENAPIKKTKKVEAVKESTEEASEEE